MINQEAWDDADAEIVVARYRWPGGVVVHYDADRKYQPWILMLDGRQVGWFSELADAVQAARSESRQAGEEIR